MQRDLLSKLYQWRKAPKRKPILLKGARQVGKTYLLKSFGQTEFAHTHHFDFVKEKGLCKIFEGDLNPDEIIKRLEIRYDLKIDLNKDLIIFDEIQECPEALTSLKYFCDSNPNPFLVASGSFLGISLTPVSYPVGKIQTQTLYPMTYFEFLEGLEQKPLKEEIIQGTLKNQIPTVVHEKAFEYLKYYLITGGLPEVVQCFRDNKSNLKTAFDKVRELQGELLDNYLNDMSKHAGKVNAVKIQTVFSNIPLQLARENKSVSKFVFKGVLPKNSNYLNLEDPIAWLTSTGLLHKVPICKQALPPLKAYTDENKFKLYLFDVGLLGLMTELKPKDIYSYDYGSYKGYFMENYVVQELKARLEKEIYSWQEGTSEIEILLDLEEGITPVEVKAGINTKAKSLKIFTQRYQPQKTYLLSLEKISLKQKGQNLLPLYCASIFHNPPLF